MYKKNLEKIRLWAKKNYNVDVLYVEYKNVINKPYEEAQKVNNFLNKKLDIEKMSKIVDKQLYREKLDNVENPGRA